MSSTSTSTRATTSFSMKIPYSTFSRDVKGIIDGPSDLSRAVEAAIIADDVPTLKALVTEHSIQFGTYVFVLVGEHAAIGCFVYLYSLINTAELEAMKVFSREYTRWLKEQPVTSTAGKRSVAYAAPRPPTFYSEYRDLAWPIPEDAVFRARVAGTEHKNNLMVQVLLWTGIPISEASLSSLNGPLSGYRSQFHTYIRSKYCEPNKGKLAIALGEASKKSI